MSPGLPASAETRLGLAQQARPVLAVTVAQLGIVGSCLQHVQDIIAIALEHIVQVARVLAALFSAFKQSQYHKAPNGNGCDSSYETETPLPAPRTLAPQWCYSQPASRTEMAHFLGFGPDFERFYDRCAPKVTVDMTVISKEECPSG